jgi:hypothetical protein
MSARSLGLCRVHVAVGLAVVLLTGAGLVWGTPKGDETVTNSHVYAFTYDEVFAGSLDAIARLGMFVETQDKAKGSITGNGTYVGRGGGRRAKTTFKIAINSVSSKPETRVTVVATAHLPGWNFKFENKQYETEFTEDLLAELQKVLATYK